MTVSIVKPTVGGDSGTWGQELNAALDAIVVGINNLEGVLGSNYLTAAAVTTLLAGYATTAQLGTLVPSQSTAPDPTKTQGWVDTSTSPAVLKVWNGTAWVVPAA